MLPARLLPLWTPKEKGQSSVVCEILLAEGTRGGAIVQFHLLQRWQKADSGPDGITGLKFGCGFFFFLTLCYAPTFCLHSAFDLILGI